MLGSCDGGKHEGPFCRGGALFVILPESCAQAASHSPSRLWRNRWAAPPRSRRTMKIILSTLAIMLAFSVTAAPLNAAQTILQKCRSSAAKVEMDYAECIKKGVVREEKGKTPNWDKCGQKRSIGILETQAIFVVRQGVDTEACGLDHTSLTISKAWTLVAAGENLFSIVRSLLKYGDVYHASDWTSDNDAVVESTCSNADGQRASLACAAAGIPTANPPLCVNVGGAYNSAADSCRVDNQGACEAVGGTWNSRFCTAAPEGSTRDCFLEGACGVDGYNHGPYRRLSKVTSGCNLTSAGIISYDNGTRYYQFEISTRETLLYSVRDTGCVTN